MKLKILLFPLSVLFFLVIVVWVIWPKWDDTGGILEKKATIKEQQNIKANILQKQSNMEKMITSLQENKNSEEFVLGYFPSSQKKEIIINNINRTASSSQVVLSAISFTDYFSASSKRSGADRSKDIEMKLGIQEKQEESLRTIAVASEGESDVEMFATVAGIKVLGNYSKIKSFISRMQVSALLNNIISIELKKVDELDEDGNRRISSDPLLSLDMNVAFGYLKMTDISTDRNLNDFIFEKEALDFSDIERLKSSIVKTDGIVQESASKNNIFGF